MPIAPYVIQFSPGSPNPGFVIEAGSVDTTSTTLTLPGYGQVAYGEGILEDLCRMLENFASATAPLVPVIGQLWYDTSIAQLKIWDGTSWINTSGAFVGPIPPVPPQLGQLWFNTIDGGLYYWDGLTWKKLATEDWVNANFATFAYLAANYYDQATSDARFVNVTGDTMTGDLVLFGGAPAGAASATPKSYVDAAIAAAVASLTTLANGALRPDPGTVGTPAAPKYYFSTAAPSGGNNGDIWFQYVP